MMVVHAVPEYYIIHIIHIIHTLCYPYYPIRSSPITHRSSLIQINRQPDLTETDSLPDLPDHNHTVRHLAIVQSCNLAIVQS